MDTRLCPFLAAIAAILLLTWQDGACAMASWYGTPFHGRPTASGSLFNRHAFTAAHRALPFGTVLRVQRPGTQKEVLVTVNDRGPFVPGRELDLSEAAARELDMVRRGVARVRYEVLTDPDGVPLEQGTVFYIVLAEADSRVEAVIHSLFSSLMLEREVGHFPLPPHSSLYFIGCGPYPAYEPAELELVRTRRLYPQARIILVREGPDTE